MAKKKRSLKPRLILFVVTINIVLLCIYQTHISNATYVYSSSITTISNQKSPNTNITFYLYDSNFTNMYHSIYTDCEMNPYYRQFQHMPDYYFFKQLNTLNVSIIHSIEEIDTFLLTVPNRIIFVVPIWNDVLATILMDWPLGRRKCIRKYDLGGEKSNRMAGKIYAELRQKIIEFETYIALHDMHHIISYKYITISHGWFISDLLRFLVYFYMTQDMFIVHYEQNVSEGLSGKARLFGYPRIIVAPYTSPLYLVETHDMEHNSQEIVNDLFFSGGVRKCMLGAINRIKACKLNQISSRVNIHYLQYVAYDDTVTCDNDFMVYNWTENEYINLTECMKENSVSETYNDAVYLNDLKQSRFCLFLRGDSYSARRFYDMIHANCIPIVVSDGWISHAAPFTSVINYDEMCYFIKEEAFEKDAIGQVSNILQLKKSKWNMKLEYIKQNKHHLLWFRNDSTVTQNILDLIT
eukprot:589136_1